jgi:phosphatidylserine decarboxylase
VGLGLIGLLQFRHMAEREQREREKVPGSRPDSTSSAWPSWAVFLYRSLPDRWLSRCWGRVNEITLPIWMRRPLLGLYVNAFGCNMEEAEDPELRNYTCLQQLFTRRLRAGVREVAPVAMVCPADSRILHFGRIGDDLEAPVAMPDDHSELHPRSGKLIAQVRACV